MPYHGARGAYAAVLRNGPVKRSFSSWDGSRFKREMVDRSREELKNIHWNAAAEKILSVYRRVCG